MVFTSPTGIYQVDLATRKIELILGGDTSQFTQGNTGAHISMIVAGRKTGRIFFTKSVYHDAKRSGRRGAIGLVDRSCHQGAARDRRASQGRQRRNGQLR